MAGTAGRGGVDRNPYGLTDNQRDFCHEYLKDFNGTEAYLRSYGSKTNRNSARSYASTLLRQTNVQAYLKDLTQKRCNELDVTAERVIKEYAAVGFSRITDAVNWHPGQSLSIKSPDEMPDEVLASIAEISTDEDERGCKARVKLHNKLTALEMLAKHTGLTNDLQQALRTLENYGIPLKYDQTKGGWYVATQGDTASTPA